MKTEYAERLRQKLNSRVTRLQSTEHGVFHLALRQWWHFLENQTVLAGILEELAHRCPSAEADAEKIVTRSKALYAETDLEDAAISYFVLKKCAESDNWKIEPQIGTMYSPQDPWGSFESIFINRLHLYLDEQLSDQRFVLVLLRRYKEKCEWFQRENLYQLWEQDTTRGEWNLKCHLFEYLHDQGLDLGDFVIEPWSASGEADFVAAQNSDDPLIADAKVFTSKSGKAYIAKGFHQVYRYTQDYNQPSGCLIIYNASGRGLSFVLAAREQYTPYVTLNNKTIFLVTIDIFPHEETASERGRFAAVKITEEDLVRIDETENTA